MTQSNNEKSQEELEVEDLTAILLEFALGLNPAIHSKECKELIIEELIENNLSIENAGKLGVLCRLTYETTQTPFDH